VGEDKINRKQVIELLVDFYKEYYHKQLNLFEKQLPKVISEDLTFEKDLNFAPEELDDFISGYSNAFKINISFFHLNTHIQGMSYELALLPTTLLYPFVGLKKWMVFKEESRVPLTIGDLANALNSKQLSSAGIFREAKRNKYQEKTYQALKKATQ